MWTYNNTDYANNYLVHHGILGQKWGIRRFQNKDGTLTPLGRKRYSDDYVNSRKNPKQMTTQELEAAARRYNAESSYSQNKINASKAKKIAAALAIGAAAAGSIALIAANSDKIASGISSARNKVKLVRDPDYKILGQKVTEAKKLVWRRMTVNDIADAIQAGYTLDFKKMVIRHSDELAHYGILGQKWGIRRFQNKDGSLTEEGLRRYTDAVSTQKDLKKQYRYKHNQITGWQEQLDKAEGNVQKAKADLKRLSKIDKGRKMIQQSKDEGKSKKALLNTTISFAALSAIAGATAAGNAIHNTRANTKFFRRVFDNNSIKMPMSKINKKTVAIGASITAGSLLVGSIAAKKMSEIKSYEKYKKENSEGE